MKGKNTNKSLPKQEKSGNNKGPSLARLVSEMWGSKKTPFCRSDSGGHKNTGVPKKKLSRVVVDESYWKEAREKNREKQPERGLQQRDMNTADFVWSSLSLLNLNARWLDGMDENINTKKYEQESYTAWFSRNKLLTICSRLNSSSLKKERISLRISDDEQERFLWCQDPDKKKSGAVFEDNME